MRSSLHASEYFARVRTLEGVFVDLVYAVAPDPEEPGIRLPSGRYVLKLNERALFSVRRFAFSE